MREPRTNSSIVTFEHPALGSVADEFMRVDMAPGIDFIRHLDAVAKGSQDHWRFVEFDRYLGIPIYKAEIDGWIMVYAVEEQSLGDRKITVLFCGRIGHRQLVGEFIWDGRDLDALRRRGIAERASEWFV